MKLLLFFLLGCFAIPVNGRDLKIFLLTGQSNSLGAVKGSPASAEMLEKYKPERTMYWHENFGQKEGVFSGASQEWGMVVPAVPSYNGNLCMGPEYGFAAVLEKKGWFDDADVAIVKASRDGGDNGHWMRNGQAYRLLVGAVKNASSALKEKKYGKIEFAGLLYLQGESDSGDAVPAAAQRFKELLKHLAEDLKGWGDTAPLAKSCAVIGENANWGTKNVTDSLTGNTIGMLNGRDTEVDGKTTWQVMRSLAASSPALGYAPTRDLPKLTSGDSMGVHYDGCSQLVIGARFAYAMGHLKGKSVGSVRSGRYDLPLNAPDAWMDGKVPVKKVCVWDLASSILPSRIGEGVDSFKAFGIRVEDPSVNTVAIAGGASQRLVVGPGGIEVQQGRKLLIASALQLSGRQEWKLSGGSCVAVARPDVKGGMAALTGQADIFIMNTDASSSGKHAAVDFTEVGQGMSKKGRGVPFRGNWVIGPGVEVKGSLPGIGKAVFKKGSIYQGEVLTSDRNVVLEGIATGV